jgi:hypothetical protein
MRAALGQKYYFTLKAVSRPLPLNDLHCYAVKTFAIASPTQGWCHVSNVLSKAPLTKAKTNQVTVLRHILSPATALVHSTNSARKGVFYDYIYV